MSIDDILRELREDRVHGASWYFLKGIEVIRIAIEGGLEPSDIKALLNELRGVRPGMASIMNLADIIERSLNVGLDLNNVINRLRDWYDSASKRLLTQLDRFPPIMCGRRQ